MEKKKKENISCEASAIQMIFFTEGKLSQSVCPRTLKEGGVTVLSSLLNENKINCILKYEPDGKMRVEKCD